MLDGSLAAGSQADRKIGRPEMVTRREILMALEVGDEDGPLFPEEIARIIWRDRIGPEPHTVAPEELCLMLRQMYRDGVVDYVPGRGGPRRWWGANGIHLGTEPQLRGERCLVRGVDRSLEIEVPFVNKWNGYNEWEDSPLEILRQEIIDARLAVLDGGLAR